MKILQITPERISINTHAPYDCRMDYQGSCIFHGLRSLFGEDVVDFPKLEHMYKGYEHSSKLWGKGFTLSQTLDDIPVDREDIVNKIANDYFQLILLTSHNLCDHYPNIFYSYLERIRELNPNVKIAVINGKDRPEVYDLAWKYTPYNFQREILDNQDERLIPIGFSIPKEKIVSETPSKSRYVASILPSKHDGPNRRTHIYNNEGDYYQDYRDSWFAIDCIKGGTTSMRNVEILAQGCLPIFTDLENVPSKCLSFMPKYTMRQIKKMKFINLPKSIFNVDEIPSDWNYILEDSFDKDLCINLINSLLGYTKQLLTTEFSAKYILEKCNCAK
jgi:hypothetical protein